MKLNLTLTIISFSLLSNLVLAQTKNDYHSIDYVLYDDDEKVLEYVNYLRKSDLDKYYIVFDSLLRSEARDPLKRAVIDSMFNQIDLIPSEVLPFVMDTFDFLVPTARPGMDEDDIDPIYPILYYIYKSVSMTNQMWGIIMLNDKLKDCDYLSPDLGSNSKGLCKNLISGILFNHEVELSQLLNITQDECHKKNLNLIILKINDAKK